MKKSAAKKTSPKTESAAPAAPKGSASRLRAIIEAYYEESFARFPAQASNVGRHEFDAELGHATLAVWEKQIALNRRTLAAVEDLPLQDFEAGAMLERRAFVGNLRQARLDHEILGRWRNNPQLHLQQAADAVYDLVIKHGDNLAPVADAIASRLRKLPRYFDEAAECIDRPDPLWQRLTQKAAPGAAELFLSLAEPLSEASGKPIAPLKKSCRAAADAALAYAKHVARKKPAAEGSFAIGEERFTTLIRDRLGLAIAPREAAAMARRWAEELADALSREARRFHAKKSASEILSEAAAEWTPQGENLLAAYRKATQQIRERFIESGWVGFPKGDRLLIEPVPAFMKDQFPTAAYSQPGALDPDQTGIFWVNDLTLQAGDEQRRRAEQAQHFGLELTAAHEAYPGHHLQYVHQNKIPSPARRMAHHAIYYEGWTLWCEQMTADLMGEDPDKPYMRLKQIHDALWRAWRIVIDVGLQTGEMSYDQACTTLMEKVGFTRGRAEGDVNWYTASPTIPMSYLMGKMELLRLKRQRVDRGDWSLREFNDWVLGFGAIPWRWIEESGL